MGDREGPGVKTVNPDFFYRCHCGALTTLRNLAAHIRGALHKKRLARRR